MGIHRQTRRGLAAAIGVCLLSAGPLLGQQQAEWFAELSPVPGGAGPTGAHPLFAPPTQESEGKSMATYVVVSSVASAAGAFAGAYGALAVSDEFGSGIGLALLTAPTVSIVTTGLTLHALGGGRGDLTVGRAMGHSFVGGLAGFITAMVAVWNDSEGLFWLGYPLVHGLAAGAASYHSAES